jgi:hypothetical protein
MHLTTGQGRARVASWTTARARPEHRRPPCGPPHVPSRATVRRIRERWWRRPGAVLVTSGSGVGPVRERCWSRPGPLHAPSRTTARPVADHRPPRRRPPRVPSQTTARPVADHRTPRCGPPLVTSRTSAGQLRQKVRGKEKRTRWPGEPVLSSCYVHPSIVRSGATPPSRRGRMCRSAPTPTAEWVVPALSRPPPASVSSRSRWCCSLPSGGCRRPTLP